MSVSRLSVTSLTEDTRSSALQDARFPDHCLVCYTDLTHPTRSPCNHDEICGICHLRLRYLHDDQKCPICKNAQSQLVVDERSIEKSFGDYNIWGDSLGEDYHFREDVGMFFPIDYFEQQVQPLFGYYCKQKDCTFDALLAPDEPQQQQNNTNNNKLPPIKALQEHLRTNHRLAMCQLCVDHQRDFVARLPRFTPNQLKNHLSKGDGPLSGFEGHPLCEFCRPTRFYDITGLHSHLHKEHYKCHVCEKQGVTNQFFKNYRSLERHFDQDHFLCHDVQCLEARFVVFGSELDLRHHERSVHGATSQSSGKIQLEFRVRRTNQVVDNQNVPTDQDFQYGLDGQAFVPQALPQQHENGEALHPLHVQRTALLREQAAALRASNNINDAEAFPELGPAAANSGPLQVGWSSGSTIQRVGRRAIGAVTEEQFPSLPTASSGTKTNKLMRTKKPSSTQRAIQQSLSGFGSAAASASATNPTPSAPSYSRPADFSSDNFPSLGGGSTTGKKPSTNNVAKSSNNFPSLNSASNVAMNNNNFPSLSNTNEFPLPQPPSKQQSIRDRMANSKAPSDAAMSNVLQIKNLSVAGSKATVEDIKTALGTVKYKKLKQLTKDFASRDIGPEKYIDQASELFDKGYGDTDFWDLMPTLVSSCPNEFEAAQALSYMETLKHTKVSASTSEPSTTNNSSNTTWSSSFPTLTPDAAPRSKPAPVVKATTTSKPQPMRTATNKKSAWGSSGAPAIMTKAPPGTAQLTAAARAGPAMGTATKFMAKEAKKEKQEKGRLETVGIWVVWR